jgi:hypothetical protein
MLIDDENLLAWPERVPVTFIRQFVVMVAPVQGPCSIQCQAMRR